MLDKIKVENILFLDIETVPEVATFSELSEEKQELYALKTQYQRKEEITAEEFYERAGIWAEFGGKEFDFPYIARRMIINNISLPDKLNLFGKKPWEVSHLDTMELWKFGDYKHYTSLKLLANILGIPSPKQDIDGSQVANVYYIENDLDKIIKYCERDTIAVAQLLLRFNNLEILQDDEITHV